MNTVGEEVHARLLGTHIIDANLGVRHTAAAKDWAAL